MTTNNDQMGVFTFSTAFNLQTKHLSLRRLMRPLTHTQAMAALRFFILVPISVDRELCTHASQYFLLFAVSPSSFIIKKEFLIAWDVLFEKH